MIRTLYRRSDAPTDPAEAFAPVDVLDPLAGVLPVHLLEECGEPEWLAVVALLGDPHAVRVDVEVVDDALPGEELDDKHDVVVEPATRALTLVPPVDEHVVVECPDCGATGLDPCRPKGNPAAGKPLTRQHRRRRELLEREAGRGGVLLLVVVVLVVLAIAGGVGGFLASVTSDLKRQVPCATPTSSGCPFGSQPGAGR